jgi:rubredoxin-NAD+ reductase
MEPIIIIGAGLAGWTTVREFRKLDTTTPVVLITGDSGDFYAKPSLSNAFAQKRAPAQLISTPAATMAQTLNVTLLAHTRADALDVDGQTVLTTQNGIQQTLAYSQLVLATGAQPIRVPVQGNAANRVLSVNSLDDFSVFHSALSPSEIYADSSEINSKTVVIMGAGLIGCEFANDLAQAGHRVHVVDPSTRPLAALLPEAAGLQLRDALGAAGVVWHFGATVQAVDAAAQSDASAPTSPPLVVGLSNGECVLANTVLSAIGLRADMALATAAGLVCERGIVVDTTLQTSAAHVYALGDCAQYASAGQRTLPYVMPIMNAARALAATLAGTPTPLVFPLMPVSIKTPALPVVVSSPHPTQAGAWSVAEEGAEGLWRFVDAEGAQRGFTLTGKHTSRRMEQVKATTA